MSHKKFKRMKRTILISIIFSLSLCLANAAELVEVGKAYSKTSVNTTVFRCNSLATSGKYQYIAYYDADGYMVVGKRLLKSKKWTLQRSQYKGNVKDAHNVISIIVDGDEYLHVSFDHHGGKLNYCRSVAPGSLALGEKEPMTGIDEGHVTYPQFFRMKDGSLVFAYRSGSSGNGNMVLNSYDLKTRRWSRLQDVLIDGEGERNAYWQMFVDEKGRFHVSWVWRENGGVETNHDLCYARSDDGGHTWKKSTGEPYRLPITLADAEYAWRIPQSSDLMNQTSMCADADGRPYIVNYWTTPGDSIPQYRIVWNDGDGWLMRNIMTRQTPFSLKGVGTKSVPVARPQIAAKKNQAYFIFRDIDRGKKVSMATTSDLRTGKWTVADLTDFSVDAWEPSFDTELWKKKKKLHIFVQETHQGDGERTIDTAEPTTVYVLEAK